jgi:selenocysteine lyase/cysteine desulfurase
MHTTALLTSQKDKFSLPPEVTYLNCAYMAPLSKSVEAAGIQGLRLKQMPYQITHQEFFTDVDRVRSEFAALINVDAHSRVAVLPSVSYGMATLAKNIRLHKGTSIIVAGEQFPSNYYSWKKIADQQGGVLKAIKAPDTWENRGQLWNERLLEAINPDTALVAIAHHHWADGTRFDLKALRARTREVGALLIIDGTQSVGAYPFDIQEIQPDALVCAAYKCMMGPYATTLAYFGEHFDQGEPLEEGWIARYGSENFAGLVNYVDEYQPGALKYDMGERSNFILIPMLYEALRMIRQWGAANIQAYCQHLVYDPIQELRNLGYFVEEEAYRAHHIFGVRLPAHTDMERLKQLLSEQQIHVSYRGNAVRVSPNVYNTEEDLWKLVDCFANATKS